ncbi:cytochrome P450 [Rhizophagus diaphanus]|nr:cytochrome P450 [Rhizophagus diaphanus] [Rhizophagus sp. MUCL 43196]
MIFNPLENFEINALSLLSTVLIIYVAYYYFKYFTRVNPLPGPFPFPIIGTFPYAIWFKEDAPKFFEYCYKKYENMYWMRTPNYEGLKELGLEGKGLVYNNNYKSWIFNHQFFNQAILSPKFTNEVIESYWDKLLLKEKISKENKIKLDFIEWFGHYTTDMINNMLTGKRSYSMAAYFNIISDEKSDHQSVRVEDYKKLFQPLHIANDILQKTGFVNQNLDTIIKRRRKEIEDTPLNEPLPHDMLTSMIIKNTFRDGNYIETNEGNRSMTDSEIRVNLFDGTSKIVNMLSIIIYYIAHNPNVKKKMLKEIDSIFQGDSGNMRPIAKDDFYSLKYCEAIVKEAARIFPIVHLNTRYIDKPSEIAGYQWPAL